MAQLTLYLDATTHERVRAAAHEAGVSVSRWVSDILKRQTDAAWPEHVRALAGAWQDAPLASELRATTLPDGEREAL